jgi:hypothetical protein
MGMSAESSKLVPKLKAAGFIEHTRCVHWQRRQ